MRVLLFTLIVPVTLIGSGCMQRTHAMECVVVNGQKVCFVRQLWGRNGDRLYVSTSENVCLQPSSASDYVSDVEGAGAHVYYKIVDGKLFVYGVGVMKKPRNAFPVPVEIDREIEGRNLGDAALNSLGYKRLPLGDMTWCLADL
jgi:hypothetical protein